MTTRRANILVIVIFGGYVIYSIINPINQNDGLKSNLLGISINILSAAVLFGLLQVLQNINQLWFFFQTRVLYRSKEIRLSISYLYRIKLDGKYLLVKNRTRNYFQPVGGAFKTLPGSEKIFEKLNVRADRLIETEKGIAKGDLRVYVKGVDVIEFIQWFNSREDRETSPWREFCEELISSEILPWRPFRFIDYKFKGNIKTPIINLQSNDKGIFIFEVYDLVPNDEQKFELLRLQEKGDTGEYIWVDEHIISRLGHDERTKEYLYDIAPHTKWALNLKWSDN